MISFSSEMLDLTSNHRIDLDVILCNSEFNLSNYTKHNGKCCFFQIFKYAQDLFDAFSGVLIRMYLNIMLNYFSFLSTNLQDEKRITETIAKHSHFLLSRFGLEVNIYYFYEFFDLFDTVNSSFCYENVVTKPKFCLYHGPHATLTIIRF